MGWGVVDCIHLAPNRDQWQALMNTENDSWGQVGQRKLTQKSMYDKLGICDNNQSQHKKKYGSIYKLQIQ
jgi:hypothetical protein